MIIDLRDYTTAPGTRDSLIERCETLFFPEQTRLGARFLGVFRDAEDGNRFIWLRAMPDLDTRRRVLTAFYSDGALWRSQRDEVNGWIVDSDNVLLVRAVSGWVGNDTAASMLAMYTCVRREPISDVMDLLRTVASQIERLGGTLLVTLATDPSDNNYPRHAIRTGETGFVWFAGFAAGADCALRVDGITQRSLLPTAQSWLR